jgi:hypothetical protein
MSVAQVPNRDAADDGLNPSSLFSRADFRGGFAVVGEMFLQAIGGSRAAVALASNCGFVTLPHQRLANNAVANTVV